VNHAHSSDTIHPAETAGVVRRERWRERAPHAPLGSLCSCEEMCSQFMAGGNGTVSRDLPPAIFKAGWLWATSLRTGCYEREHPSPQVTAVRPWCVCCEKRKAVESGRGRRTLKCTNAVPASAPAFSTCTPNTLPNCPHSCSKSSNVCQATSPRK
jgi:hypothetical protein